MTVDTPEAGTRCTQTGLHLVPASAVQEAYRVALDRGERTPLQGYPNQIVGPLPPGLVEQRGRFDRFGRTVYFADTPSTAFAEVLSGFRRELAKIAPLAAIAGMTPAEWAAKVVADAGENHVDPPWAVSGDWQWQRSIYRVRMPGDGWWVQVDHADTLTALNSTLVTHLPSVGVDVDGLLTSGHLEAEDRAITTLIAAFVAQLSLQDGHQALGISYQSKTLMGRCYAFFDRRADDDLPPGTNDPKLLSSTNVYSAAFLAVTKQYGLPVLQGRSAY